MSIREKVEIAARSNFGMFAECHLLYLILAFSIFFYSASNSSASGNFQNIDQFIGINDSILIADPAGKIIYSKNQEKKLIPASSLKVFTALMALHYLHDDFRFPIEFYVDNESNLKIKGYGDPLLISENVSQISLILTQRLSAVKNIFIDDSYFKKPIHVPGIFPYSFEPYNAPNGALNVNFNTINFIYQNGEYISAEPQTPFLQILMERIKSSGLKSGRISLSNTDDQTDYYAGQLFAFFLKTCGLKISGDLKLGQVNEEKDRLIYRHISEFTTQDIIVKLLAYSNNYIANQIFLFTGATVFGPQATLEKGIDAAHMYADSCLGISGLSIVEGSGISRDNRISAVMFFHILNEFKPYRNLMRHCDNEFYKTGTLDGVRTRVGFIETRKDAVYTYVLLLNTPGKTTDPIMIKIKESLH